MKVLIYQKENLHTETIGYFLSLYRNDDIHFCHKFENSPFNWTEVYRSKLEKELTYVTDETRLRFAEYDVIIFLTSRDIMDHLEELQEVQNNKVIQVRHTSRDKYSPDYPNISLSPLVKADHGNILTIADGCHRGMGNLSFDEWNFTVMGLAAYSAPKKDVEDLILFAKQLEKEKVNAKINIISKKGPYSEELEKLSNVEMHYSLSAEESYKVLERTHFLLPIPKAKGAYYKDRMTGIIPMAYSFGVLMCAPKDFLDIYDIRRHYPYINSLTSIISNFKNLKPEDYYDSLQVLRRESVNLQIEANNLIKSITNGTIQMEDSTKTSARWF
jgi:glycosyltransferase involved in cell wall biosynthesis